MRIWIFGVIASVGVSANTWAATPHLVYHCTFDNLDAITSPVVGEGGTKNSGMFVTGKIGNAIQIPAYAQAVRVPFSNGLPAGKGRIEFWGRIDNGRTFFYDRGDPALLTFFAANDAERIILEYTANNGYGNSGLSMSFPGTSTLASCSGWSESMAYSCVLGSGDPAGWHYYEVIWNTNGTSVVSGNPALAVVIDGKVVLSQSVSGFNATAHASGMSGIRYMTMTRNNYDRGRSSYSIDEFKVWDTDVSVSELLPVIKPASGTEFATSLTISISCADKNAVIRYTVDGGDPTSTSSVYAGKFRIYDHTIVKAVAFYEDGTQSEVVMAEYTQLKCADPVVVAPDEFTGSKMRVSLSCSTDGASIYYTTDGSVPTTSSQRYEKSFCVTNTCTIKAIAVKEALGDSNVTSYEITRNWCIGDTLGAPDREFLTDGDAGFECVTDATLSKGQSMRSGKIGNDEESIMSTIAVGPGVLTFKWKTSCEYDVLHEWDHAEFSVDGDILSVLDGQTDWEEVTLRIDTEGDHEIMWTYVKDDCEKVGEDCVWVSSFAWKSDYVATQTTETPVPYEWLSSKCIDVVNEYESYESAAKSLAANSRMTVEQCYVAGLDPESTTNEFSASIAVIDGIPTITWKPDLKDERWYKIWGKETLDDTSEWEYPTNALHHFFKVTVEMP